MNLQALINPNPKHYLENQMAGNNRRLAKGCCLDRGHMPNASFGFANQDGNRNVEFWVEVSSTDHHSETQQKSMSDTYSLETSSTRPSISLESLHAHQLRTDLCRDNKNMRRIKSACALRFVGRHGLHAHFSQGRDPVTSKAMWRCLCLSP